MLKGGGVRRLPKPVNTPAFMPSGAGRTAASIAAIISGMLVSQVDGVAVAGAQPTSRHATTSEQLRPGRVEDTSSVAPSEALNRRSLLARLLDRREETAARVDNRPRGNATPRSEAVSRPTVLSEAPHGPGVPVVAVNRRNSVAIDVSSTVAEPSAANDGRQVFYTGNTYASVSADAGATWAPVEIPPGRSDAPVPCCDLNVLRDPVRDVTIWSVLYLDEPVANGSVALYVRRSMLHRDDCVYFVDPAGTANNMIPDYPHLGITKNFLYVMTSNLRHGAWAGSQVRRLSLDHMSRCLPVRATLFAYGGEATSQRVFTPAEGSPTVMYWGAVETTSTFRVFQWPENSVAVSSIVRPIAQSNFTNPDCRGGADNSDFIDRPTSFSIAGFRLRGAAGGGRLSFFWNVGPDAHRQGHVHGVVFEEATLAVLTEPRIHNPLICIGYPVVDSNDRGDIGISLAAGGGTHGRGRAAQGYVGVSDGTSSVQFEKLLRTAEGTHNPPDGRYGDYFSMRPNSRCPHAWVTTNYGLLNGNVLSEHVNARYIEFGSSADQACLAS